MIILQEELAQEFRKEVLESFCLLDIDFPVPVYLTETDNQVIHDEKIYVPRGFSFDNINSAPGLSVAEIDLLIDNTDHAFSSILLHGDQRGREVKISLGAVIGGTGPLVDGEVKTATRANTKISAVDGSAFVDFSESAYLTLPEHRGCKLTITDSAGKKLVGYIKAAGTGETLGSEAVPNGTFENTSGWISTTGLIASVAGGQSGNCLQVTENGTEWPGAVAYNIPFGLGKLYKWISGYVKAGTNSTYQMYLVSTYYVGWETTQTASSSWVNKANGYYFTAPFPSPTANFVLRNMAAAGSGKTMLFDEMSIKQVLTPSTTGVTITSTPDGDTQNWADIEAGFDFYDAAGYDWEIIRHGSIPVAGAVISCDLFGRQRIRCRFAEDNLSRELFVRRVYRTGIKLKGLKG